MADAGASDGSQRPYDDHELTTWEQRALTLVAVIVPAFNAERTIDATLASVRAQTHSELEIIVVDDGSTDGTAATVMRHAADDPRIRLIAQANAGVAAARNRGIAEATAKLIAPIDADDLWHPEKIALQVEEMRRKPKLALVCTAYLIIDERSRVAFVVGGRLPHSTRFEDLCRRNFIGNGSSAMMKRSVILSCGGYDPSLRDQGAEGCEDLKLYLQIAHRHEIAMIHQPLTSYRQLTGNMSSESNRMLRSFDLVAESFCVDRPELRKLFRSHRTYMTCWLASRALRAQNWRAVLKLSGKLIMHPNRAFPVALGRAIARRVRAVNRIRPS